MAVEVGTGSAITLSSTGIDTDFKLIGLNWDGRSVPPVDFSNMASLFAVWKPGLVVEPGAITLQFHWDPEKTLPPVGTVETITVKFGATPVTPHIYSVSGFIHDIGIDDPLENPMTATMIFKCNGEVTKPV